MWRHVRQLIALTAGAAVAMLLVATTSAAAWGSADDGGHRGPVVHTTTPTPRPLCPPVTHPPYRPPVTHPPYRPPVTRPPVTRPPVTHPPTTPPTTVAPGGHTAGGPPTTKPVTSTTTPATTVPATAPAAPVTAVGVALPLSTFDTFQAFVKGLEADAQQQAAARAAAARANLRRRILAPPVAGGADVPAVVNDVPAAPAPDVFPRGPLFNDTPAPLLPLGASGLRSARSFVLLFGLSAVALGFLAFRARLARRHGMFGTAVYDERGDFVDFV